MSGQNLRDLIRSEVENTAKLDSSPVFYIPSSLGGADDAANITGMLAEIAGKKRLSIVPNASGNAFAIKTPIAVPSRTVLDCDPGAIFGSTMSNTGVGGFTQAVFFATLSNVGAQNALTADAIVGSNQIQVTSPVAVGSMIAIRSAAGGNQQQTARVIATSNGGLTLVLDEEILYGYFTVSGAAFCYVFSPPHDIWILANGLRVFGTGDRVCEFAFGHNIHVDGIVVDPSLGNKVDGFLNILFSMDVGCRDSGYSRCIADGGVGILSGTVGLVGFALEAGNRGYIRHCKSQNMSAAAGCGFSLYDHRNGTLESCAARNCRAGVFVGANDANGTEGTRGLTMHGIHTEKCGLFGMYFEHNSRAQVYGWTDVGSSGSIELSGSPGDTGHDVLVDGFRWTAPATGTYNGWLTLFGRLTLMNGTADMTSTSGQKALCDWGSASDGTLFIENVRTISGAFGLYLEDGANQRVIRGANVDLSSTSTPYRRGNQSKLNFGTVTLNGASDVVVSGAFLADQPIALSFNTLSGSLGAYPTIKAKSADSFTVKGTAGDNSVYDWAAK